MSADGGTKRTLRQLRDESELTQFEVAQQLGVTITTVYQWERGASEPYARHLLKLAQLYNVSPFDIALPEVERPKKGKAAA